MENELESDKTYLRSENAVRWYFLAICPLCGSIQDPEEITRRGLSNRISVGEELFELSKVTKIVEKSGREYFAKIPKCAKRMYS